MAMASLAALRRKLCLLGVTSETRQAAVLASVSATRRVGPGQGIVGPGEVSDHVVFLLDGLAARYKSGPRGERQILAFCIAGDSCTAQNVPSGFMDHGVGAITVCTLALIPRRAFLDLVEADPALTMAFWRDTAADAAVEREWIFNLGRRNATAGLAHLLCEVHARMERAGLATPTAFPFPVTQSDLADAVGLSTVHVNRSLQSLRRAGLIVFAKGEVTVLDPDGLRAAAGFDGAYLNMEAGWTASAPRGGEPAGAFL